MCPDQKMNLQAICRDASAPLSSLSTAASRQWKYSGHLLMLSMWLCITTTDDVLKRPLSTIQSNRKALVDTLVNAFNQDGAALHPEVMLNSVLG